MTRGDIVLVNLPQSADGAMQEKKKANSKGRNPAHLKTNVPHSTLVFIV